MKNLAASILYGAVIAAAVPGALAATPNGPVEECRRLAGSQDEPNNPEGIGVEFHQIDSVPAIKACSEATRLDPNDPVAHYRLARAYTAFGPRQDIRYGIYLQRDVWGLGKRASERLGGEAASWYASFGERNLKPSTYEAAANNGNVVAQMSMAFLNTDKRLFASDLDAAVAWMRKAADQGYVPAQYWLGFLLEWKSDWNGEATEEALKLYRLAADKGYMSAYSGIGLIHALGRGVPVDGKLAFENLGKAANAGGARIQVLLGDWLKKGIGEVPPNLQLARRWYQIAAESGDQEAKNKLQAMDEAAGSTDAAALAIIAGLGLLVLMSGDSAGSEPYDGPGPDDLMRDFQEEQRKSWQSVCDWMTPTEKAVGGCGW
jgi:TPR repeat protein